MIEQSYKHEYGPPPADPGLPCLPPVEGRVDVAEDVEEEQRRAYSARHRETEGVQTHGTKDVVNQPSGGFDKSCVPPASCLPPAEGRVDVARDVEEEQHDAYSAHHH